MCGIVVQTVFVDAVEKRGQAVVIALGNGIKLMIVAATAFERQAQDSRTESLNAVGDVFSPPLFLNAAALVSLPVETIKRSSQPLLTGGMLQQIAGELLGEKTIVRQVVVEGVHDPTPIRPGGAQLIALVTIAVSVTYSVQPRHGQPLPEML